MSGVESMVWTKMILLLQASAQITYLLTTWLASRDGAYVRIRSYSPWYYRRG